MEITAHAKKHSVSQTGNRKSCDGSRLITNVSMSPMTINAAYRANGVAATDPTMHTGLGTPHSRILSTTIALLLLLLSGWCNPALATRFADNVAGACAAGTYRITQRDCGGSGTGHQSYSTLVAFHAALSPSERGIVRAGTWSTGLESPPSGTSGTHTIIEGCPAGICATQETPIIDPSSRYIIINSRQYVTVRNFKVSMCNGSTGTDSGISTNNSTDILFQYIEVDGCPIGAPSNGRAGGIFTYHPNTSQNTRIVFDRVYIHDIPGSNVPGFRHHGAYINSRGVTIQNSTFENVCNASIHYYHGGSNTDEGVIRDNLIINDGIVATHASCSQQTTSTMTAITAYGSGLKIFNNVARNGIGGCIEVQQGNDASIFGNTCSNNGGGTGISVGGAYTNAVIKNNLLNSSGTIEFLGTGNSSNNRCNSTSTHCQLNTAPRFADAANFDFRLCTAAGVPHPSCPGISGLIDAGADVGSPYNVDFAGTSRPQGAGWDIGAYESSSGASCPTTPALVAQYMFDGDLTDSSGNANHGTAGAGVTYDAFGKFGQAASFAGTEAVVVPDSASLWLCTGFTIAAWVKPSTTPTDFRAIAVKNYRYFMYSSSAGYCGTGAPLIGYEQVSVATSCYTSPFSAATWAHFAATYDGTNLKIYINNVLTTSAAASAILDSTVGDLTVGGSQFGEYFEGLIDQMRVYNYPRSNVELLADMGSGSIVTNKVGAVTRKFAGGITRKYGFVQ